MLYFRSILSASAVGVVVVVVLMVVVVVVVVVVVAAVVASSPFQCGITSKSNAQRYWLFQSAFNLRMNIPVLPLVNLLPLKPFWTTAWIDS